MKSRNVGSFGKAHGLIGEIKFYPLVDGAWFVPGLELMVDDTVYVIDQVRPHQDHLLVRFSGVSNREEAEAFRNRTAWSADPPALEESEYWLEDLVGLAVVDVEGKEAGTVVEVISGPAQARLVIDGPDGSFELPFVTELVPDVDVAAGWITIDPPHGLRD